MKAIRGYLPGALLLGAIAANHVAVWHGHDTIIVYSDLLGIVMLLPAIGCIAVVVRALRFRQAAGWSSSLIVSLVALIALVLDILIPMYPQRARSNHAMQPTTGRRTAELFMTQTSSPAATRALASGG